MYKTYSYKRTEQLEKFLHKKHKEGYFESGKVKLTETSRLRGGLPHVTIDIPYSMSEDFIQEYRDFRNAPRIALRELSQLGT